MAAATEIATFMMIDSSSPGTRAYGPIIVVDAQYIPVFIGCDGCHAPCPMDSSKPRSRHRAAARWGAVQTGKRRAAAAGLHRLDRPRDLLARGALSQAHRVRRDEILLAGREVGSTGDSAGSHHFDGPYKGRRQ